MPMKDEVGDFEKYGRIQVVELLELIGRAAKVRFVGTDYEEEPLARRIEMILD